jgi:hypothetical protein
MMRKNRQHSFALACAALVAGAVAFVAPSFAGSAHSTRPPSGSSGGTVSHGGSSSSSSSHGSSSSSGSHGSTHGGSSGSSHDGDRTPVQGESRWHQGHRGGGNGYYGAYWRGAYNGWYGHWGPFVGPWSIGWWGYWGPYSYYYDTPAYYGTRVYPNDDYGAYGALDLDVSPEKAEVYVNGQRIGVADDYDGYPTYLWLEQGVYDVVFYLDGFETIARQYVIRPGLVIDVEDTMTPGQAIRPEDLPAKSHENRDARLKQNREIEEDAARGMRQMPAGPEAWRERVHPLDRAPMADGDGGGDAAHRPTSEDARVAPARLKVNVEPGDASVYLDGRFVGTGAEIEQLPNGLLIDAGRHRIEAVRPGRRAVSKEFTAEPGGDSQVDLTLSE